MAGFRYTTAISKMRKMKARIKIIQGGTSGGKTFGILPILIDQAIKLPNITISVVSESMPHLRRGCIKDFLNIMKSTHRFIDKHWNTTISTYKFGNGSVIEFFSVEDGDKLRGARRNLLYVNECNNIKYDAFNQLAMRTDGDIWLDYNPTHKFWIEEVKESNESELLILTYKDNEALSANIISFLESKRELAKTSSYWANWCKVYLDGQTGSLEGIIFNNYSIIDTLPDEAKIIAIGVDFGYTNDATAVVAVYKFNEKIVVDELIYQKGLLNSQIAKMIKDTGIDTYIFCDSSEPKSIDELKINGLYARPVKKGAGSVLYGIQLLQNYEMLITKKSKNLITELENYKWKDKDGEALNQPIDNFNHCIDALRYVAMERLQLRSNAPMISF